MTKIKNKANIKYMNEFPIIIVIIVVALVIVLTMMYLNIKPYKIMNKNGYMVLANNMTYNLINGNSFNDEKLDVGTVPILEGDYLYKQMDTYYVGVEKKQEVDYDYPFYSSDGLTIYNQKEDVILIDRNFDKLIGYPGLSLSYGILYNEGDYEPVDEIDYLFLYLNNSIYINAQTMTIKTYSNEYTIPMHSPIHFDTNYINYYIFDGNNFKYYNISDIYYDSLVTIGNIKLTYNEFMKQMGLIKIEDIEEEKNTEEDKEEIKEEEKDDSNEVEYIKPVVSVSKFAPSVYYITSELSIKDPLGAIVSNPMFEVYEMDGRLYSRKRYSSSSKIKISGLSSNTKYKIIGKYKYKNENGTLIDSTFYEEEITTKDFRLLDEIEISSELGKIYPNKIEIKDINIINNESEAVSGIKTAVLELIKEDTNKAIKVNLSYFQMMELVKGQKVTITSSDNLTSNTVYNYEIKFYDKDENELPRGGDISGTIKTSKIDPNIEIKSNTNTKNNTVKIDLKTKNPDNIYVKNFEYQLYSYTGKLFDEGKLNYEDKNVQQLIFDNLDYNTNYILKITGIYDLEDGNGQKDLYKESDFTTAKLDSFTAMYNEESLVVTTDSIAVDIEISKSTIVLEKPTTEVIVYLADEDGNAVLDSNGELKHYKKYTKEDYSEFGLLGYKINVFFEGLQSLTKYNLKMKINVKQFEEDITLEKTLTGEEPITTLPEPAYVTVINKKLIGDRLDFTLQVNDVDNLINPEGVIIEIYKGNLNSYSQISERYVYRNIIKDKIISFNYEGYLEDEYTIFVISKPYNGVNNIQYLDIKNDNGDMTKTIHVNRNISASLEMYQQLNYESDESILKTEINLKYNLFETKADIHLVDCVDGICTNIAYIDSNKEITGISEKYHRESSDNDTVSILNKKEDKDHKFYLLIEKVEGTISKNQVISFFEGSISDSLYILTSLDYNTKNEIYNISKAEDFFSNKIKTDQETRHYVVTNNIDFNQSKIISSRFENFNGIIDFQGYSVKIYNDYESIFTLFNSVGEFGVLKNVVLEYNLNYVGVKGVVSGFVATNSGTLENIIMRVNQQDANTRAQIQGLLTQNNKGIIDSFVCYLESDVTIYSFSSLLIYENNGKISNGYATSNPKKTHKFKINFDGTSGFSGLDGIMNMGHGIINYVNKGIIENIYSLISVESITDDYNGSGLATIVYENRATGIVKNTISVATTTQISGNEQGPNIFLNSGVAINNYYIDTNLNNIAYISNYTKKISSSALVNTGIWNFVINMTNKFVLNSGYYPLLKMNELMKNKQDTIKVSYDYSEATIDILSSEIIQDNKNSNYAQTKIYVSNPNKYEITKIEIEDLTTKIIDKIYDESSQSTIVTVNLSLQDKDKAKTIYNIISLKYLDDFGIETSKEYEDTNLRTLEITMYRNVYTYKEFVTAINNNENIFFIDNIKVTNDNEKITVDELPITNQIYNAILDGNEKTLDFDKKEIDRHHFIYQVNGTIKNLQIKNLIIPLAGEHTGFIGKSLNATISNVDMSDIVIEFNLIDNLTDLYLGPLVSYSENSFMEKVSINNLIIKKARDYKSRGYEIRSNYVGGIAGYLFSSQIQNSYVYNLNISNMYLDIGYGNRGIGGIVGYLDEYSTVSNCYTTGTINTEYSNVGGISGEQRISTIQNNYSYMKIISSGNYIGGIMGMSWQGGTYYITNNMFIGHIINKNPTPTYSLIVPLANNTRINNNYALEAENKYSTVKRIENITNLKQFDINQAFFQNQLPYLSETSFVEQQVIDDEFRDLSVSNFSYSIAYKTDGTCNINNNIKDVNTGVNIYSELYNSACTSSAELTFANRDVYYEIEDAMENLSIEYDEQRKLYELTPIKFLNSYNVTIDGESIDLDLKFYRKVKNQEDWNEISNEDFENVIVLNNIELDSKMLLGKKVGDFLGNGHIISLKDGEVLNDTVISDIRGVMRDVNFKNINIESDVQNHTGIIRYNNGKVENCSFEDISISNNFKATSIISISAGHVNNIKLNNINVSGDGWVGGLIAYDQTGYYSKVHVTKVHASNLNVVGSKCVGGVMGRSTYALQDIHVNGLVINVKKDNPSEEYKGIGGIVGQGECIYNCTIKNSEIYVTDAYRVGGIGGSWSLNSTKSYLTVENVLISDNVDGVEKGHSREVGGIYGTNPYTTNCTVKNLTIANASKDPETKEITIHADFDGEHIGGISGHGYNVQNSKLENSYISGDNAGGIIGYSLYGTISGNIVTESTISSTYDYAGGIVGKTGYSLDQTYETPSNIYNNAIVNSNVYGSLSTSISTTTGGIVGHVANDISVDSQNFQFKNNYALGINIAGYYSGGLIGRIDQVPASSEIKFTNSLFYGNIEKTYLEEEVSLIGKIGKLNTGAISGYGEISTYEEFVQKSSFKEYTLNKTQDYQINSVSNLLPLGLSVITYNNKDYFKINNITNYPSINATSLKYYVEIPAGEHQVMSLMATFSMPRMFRNYSNSYNNSVDIEYDVYASGINKINIEFNDVDEKVYFYYEIGEYVSDYIPVTNRTYTITYDFKNDIKLYVSNGFNYKESVYQPQDLSKTVSIINGETYYINNNSLYSQSKMIVGTFKNLYGKEALTIDGKIYNIVSKQEYDTNIDYNILENATPIYEFVYRGNSIKTYYRYSLVNGSIKELQLLVKNGVLNSINSSLNNKKDMYIIDYYNNNNIQVVLKDDGKLYNMKHDIKYPNEVVNNQIAELYTDMNSSDNVVSLKYENGTVCTFNYRTGELLFNNVSKENLSFLDYIKEKMNVTSKYNVIENITGHNKYKEVELLKNKILDVSIEEANDKIYDTNNATNINEDYISVYNELTQNYDVYKVSTILDNSLKLESETSKVYNDYELVKFYRTLGQGKKKSSVSGIVMFSVSIVSILITLTLLIKHKINKRSIAK